MYKETIKKQLNRFGYDHTDHGEILTVRLGFSLYGVIDLSDTEKIKVTERLTSWNPLTGIIETTLKGAMLYNTFGSLVIALLFIFLAGYVEAAILIIVFLTLMGYILLWTLFYLIKTESFRLQVRSWTK